MVEPVKPVAEPGYIFGAKLYDVLKFIALIFLPAVASLYYGLAGIWDFPRADDVVGTITIVDTFLGALVGISSRSYNASARRFDGAMNVDVHPESGKKTFSLELNGDPEELEGKKQVVFQVKPRPRPY